MRHSGAQGSSPAWQTWVEGGAREGGRRVVCHGRRWGLLHTAGLLPPRHTQPPHPLPAHSRIPPKQEQALQQVRAGTNWWPTASLRSSKGWRVT